MTSKTNPNPSQDRVEELKPCPFCGSAPKLDNIGSGQCVRIYCDGENCTPYPSVRKYANGDALERAIAAWNTRPESEAVTVMQTALKWIAEVPQSTAKDCREVAREALARIGSLA